MALENDSIAPDTMSTDTVVKQVVTVLAAPESVNAKDAPNDNGERIVITWVKEVQEEALTGYQIYRSESIETGFEKIAEASRGMFSFNDNNVENKKPYYYKVAVTNGIDVVFSEVSNPAIASAQWFDASKITGLIIAILLSTTIILLIYMSKKGKRFYIRRIAGLTAVEEAIGRATEMGRPLLFIPGIMDINDVQTIAGITILHKVAKTVAEYDTRLQVPCSRSLVMATAREMVKEAYLAAGRPDAFQEDDIHYLTDEQFGFVAAVNGIIVREKPATCLYMGAFYAESLILAETGNSIGAMQIAGTAMPTQIPFFIVACDYTLIGEELFAASAYLSEDPKQLGSLKGQDAGKLMAIFFIAAGSLSATLAQLFGGGFFKTVTDVLVRWFTL
jgi:hypothetical protein